YPEGLFPDSASALVDLERREQFEGQANHDALQWGHQRSEGELFESSYFVSFVWLPPAEETSRMESWLYEGRATSGVDPKELL
ncbi:MAG: hypothetical protein E5W15_35560, partial [Mesorhizobium sp.]